LLTGFERRHAGTLVLVVVCGAGGRANERGDVGAAVTEGVGVSVDGVVVTAVAGVEGAGGVGNDDAGVGNAAAVVVSIVVGSIVEMLGWWSAGEVGGDGAYAVAVAGVGDVGVVGVERAGGGGGAGSIVGGEGARSVDDAVAAVCAVTVRTRGRWGVSDVGGAGLGKVEVEVKGVLLVFERKPLHLVGAFRVAMKNGRKVVGWAR